MSIRKNIEVYKQIENFNTPLAESNKIATCSIGDFVMIIDDEVFVRDYSDDSEEHFAKAIYSADFVRMNNSIFEKQ